MPCAVSGAARQLGEGSFLPRGCPAGAADSSPSSSILPLSARGLRSLGKSGAWCWGGFSWERAPLGGLVGISSCLSAELGNGSVAKAAFLLTRVPEATQVYVRKAFNLPG